MPGCLCVAVADVRCGYVRTVIAGRCTAGGRVQRRRVGPVCGAPVRVTRIRGAGGSATLNANAVIGLGNASQAKK
jgi:hypothetical protein